MTRRTLIVVAASALLAAGCNPGSDASPEPSPTWLPKYALYVEGRYEVPEHIRPGTLQMTSEIMGFHGDEPCSWVRLGPNGTRIAEKHYTVGDWDEVTVEASDEAIEFKGDCTWARVEE